MANADFGPIIDKGYIERSLVERSKLWLPTYLSEMERRTDREPQSLPHVRSWPTHNEFEALPGEEQLPMCVIVSPGLASDPIKSGEGTYRAVWQVAFALVVSARDLDASRDLAGVYSAAVRTMAVQRAFRRGLGYRSIDWTGERYDDLDINDERTLAVARITFNVDVDRVANIKAGPDAPVPLPDHHEPYELPVEIQTTHVEVQED